MSRMRREDGQTMAEYGVVLAVLVLAAAAFASFADVVRASIERATTLIP